MISPDRVSFRMLTDKQIAEIHRATLEVLEKTGVRMEHPEAQQLLVGAGCTIGDDDIVRFPADVIERALETSPHHVTVYNRTGTPRMELTDRNVYYGTVTSLPFMADADGTRRPYTLEDCRQMTLIMDYLDSLDFATGTGNCSDVPPEVCDVHEISCMLEHSAKPALITTHDEAGLDAITEICAAYKGGLDGFRLPVFSRLGRRARGGGGRIPPRQGRATGRGDSKGLISPSARPSRRAQIDEWLPLA